MLPVNFVKGSTCEKKPFQISYISPILKQCFLEFLDNIVQAPKSCSLTTDDLTSRWQHIVIAHPIPVSQETIQISTSKDFTMLQTNKQK